MYSVPSRHSSKIVASRPSRIHMAFLTVVHTHCPRGGVDITIQDDSPRSQVKVDRTIVYYPTVWSAGSAVRADHVSYVHEF